MSYEYKPHTWVPKEIISADKMNELEKAAEQVGKLKSVSETGSYNDLIDKPTKLSQFENDQEFQTESEVVSKIANANHLKRQIVEKLPDVGTADVNTIYMLKLSNGVEQNTYAEYMVIDNKWEKLGTSDVDLTNYMKTDEINRKLAERVPITRTINSKPLSSDITLVYADISDAPQPMTEEEVRAIFS